MEDSVGETPTDATGTVALPKNPAMSEVWTVCQGSYQP